MKDWNTVDDLLDDIHGGQGEVAILLGEFKGLRGKRLGKAGFMRSNILLADGRTVTVGDAIYMPVADIERIKARGRRF